jgi:hypothetical protein
MLAGDGSVTSSGTTLFHQNAGPNAEVFQMLCSMLGEGTSQRRRERIKTTTTVFKRKTINGYCLEPKTVHYKGVVWCPRTSNGTWMARRNGHTFWTGNTYVAKHFFPFIEDTNAFLRRRTAMINSKAEAFSQKYIPPSLYEKFGGYDEQTRLIMNAMAEAYPGFIERINRANLYNLVRGPLGQIVANRFLRGR